MGKKSFVGAAVLFLIVLFLGGAGVLPVVDHNLSVQEYEPTESTIETTDIEWKEDDDGDRSYRPVITYTYRVDGETYTQDNVFPGRFTRWDSDRSWAQNIVEQYEAGEQTTVYHSPRDHGQAYLHNDGWPTAWYVGGIHVAVALLAGFGFVSHGFKRRKQRALIKDTPTEQAQSLSIGPSEITGTAVTGERDPISAPFSDDEVVLASYEIEEYDDDNDDSGWDTIEENTLFTPFYVDDGTGEVLVRPHEDATIELDPDDWTTVKVDSSNRGPKPVQEFVERNAEVDYPTDSSGKDNDRKYKQNLIETGDSVYVFGTVQPRDEDNIAPGAANEQRLVVRKVEDDAFREPMYMISDDTAKNLKERRQWAVLYLPIGALFLIIGFASVMFMFAPILGLELPVLF